MTKQRSTTKPDPQSLTQSQIDNDRMGTNKLQGDDQESVRNERQATPDMRNEADDVEQSFRKLDKDRRARTDLNKGATSRKGATSGR